MGKQPYFAQSRIAHRAIRSAYMALSVTMIAMLCAPSRIAAQPDSAGSGRVSGRIVFGPAAAFEFGVPLTLNRAADAPYACNCDGTGTSYGVTVWGGAELMLRRLFGKGFGLDARLAFGASSGRFTSTVYDDASVPPINGAPRRNRFFVDAAATQIGLDLLADLSFNRIGVALGPSLAYRISGRFVQTERIVSPDTGTFISTGTNEREVASGDRLAAANFMTGIVARASYRVPLGGATELRPGVYTRLDLDALSNGVGLRSFSFGAGISFFFDPAPAVPAADMPLPSSLKRGSDTARRAGPFSATLDIYGFDDAGNVIQTLTLRPRTIYYNQYTPFSPIFFFDRDSAALPSRYVRYGRDAFRIFSVDSLARADARTIYYQGLNVLGLRLRSDRAATVTLTGGRNAGEPESLAMARAMNVRAYLVEHWGIDSARISVRARAANGNAPGDRSVIVHSATNAVADAVHTEWVIQDLRAPKIGLDPRFSGGAGMKRWDIVIRQDGQDVARYSSDGREDHQIDFNSVAGDAVPSPLVAEISALDSAGALAVASDRLPLRIEGGTGASDSNEHFTTAWLLPAPDSLWAQTDSLGLVRAAGIVKDGDQITLSYSRAEGVISRRRARHAEEVLEVLLSARGIRVERVDLVGDDTPPGPERREYPEDKFLRGGMSFIIDSKSVGWGMRR